MSLTTTSNWQQYAQTTVGQTFAVPFYIFAASDLLVIRTRSGVDTALVLTTDYSVANAGTNPSTAAVTLVSGQIGDVVTITRAQSLTQNDNYTNNGPLPAASLTSALDRLTMYCQQLKALVDRCVRIPLSNSQSQAGELALTTRANAIPCFDGSGNLTVTTRASIVADGAAAASTAAAAAAASASSAADSAAAAAGSAASISGQVLTSHAGLRATVTAAVMPLNSFRIVRNAGSGETEFWQLISGTNADDDTSYIRPSDYNSGSNAVVWIRIL